MSFFGAGGNTAAAVTPAVPQEKDIEVADPPPDSISCISFSPQAEYLAVGSWDNNVRNPVFLSRSLCSRRVPGSYLRSRRKWPDTGESNDHTPGSCSRRLLEQGSHNLHRTHSSVLISDIYRMEHDCSQGALTTRHECTNLPLASQRKSARMTRLFGSSSGSRPLKGES